MRLGAGALVWSAGLVLAALVAPAGSTSASSADGLTLGHATLVQTNGLRALVLTAIPLVVSAFVLATLRIRGSGTGGSGFRWAAPLAWTAIAVLAVEAILGLMSIGLFIAPVPLLLVAAMRGRRLALGI
jgi:hypothetical protein